MRKETNPAPEDTNVISVENRRSKAEGEFVILLDDKKRVFNDIQKINDDIKIGKETIQKNNSEINETNQEIINTQSLLSVEKQNLEVFLKQKEQTKKEIEYKIKKNNEEKNKINSDILFISKKYEILHLKKSQEIKCLENDKYNYEDELKKINKTIIDKDKEVSHLQKKIDGIEYGIEELIKKNNVLESLNLSLAGDIENKNRVIENNKVIIDQQNETKKVNELEVSNLDNKISDKKDEYVKIEAKAFAILHKQDVVDQKEIFIKSQYERAGIKWE